MKLLLDTHAAVWLLQGDPRLGSAARRALSSGDGEPPYISDIVLLELSLLVGSGSVVPGIALPAFLRRFAANLQVLPIDADIAAAVPGLRLPHADPFDRVIVATALRHHLRLVTRDRAIRDSGLVDTLW